MMPHTTVVSEDCKMPSLWLLLLLAVVALGSSCDTRRLVRNLSEHGNKRRAVPLDYAKQVRDTKAELERYYKRLDKLSDKLTDRYDFEFGLYVDVTKRFVGFLRDQDEPPFDRPDSRRSDTIYLPNPKDLLLKVLKNYTLDARTRTQDVKEVLKLALSKLQKLHNLVEYNCKKNVDGRTCARFVGETVHHILNRCPAFYHTLELQESSHEFTKVVRKYEEQVREGVRREGGAYYFYTNLPEAANLAQSLSGIERAVTRNTKCNQTDDVTPY